jgi:hypothetical protein
LFHDPREEDLIEGGGKADEGLMALGAIDGDAKQLGATSPKFRQDMIVKRHPVAANRAPVGRIESENYPPPGKFVLD